jgi:uncharacterized protein YecT (DUF1311 family)
MGDASLHIRALFQSLIFLILFSASAHSDPCADSETQAELNSCANRGFKQADQELNAVYLKLKTRYADDQGAVSALAAAQRTWIKFRDAECELDAYATKGGSIQPMVRLFCLEGLTRFRTKQLFERLNCEEGDLSCIWGSNEK